MHLLRFVSALPLTLVALTGCATTKTAVRDAAAAELACPRDAIDMTRVDRNIYRATGCGASVEIACYDPQASTGAAKGWADPLTAGNRVHCETLLQRPHQVTVTGATTPQPATTTAHDRAAVGSGFDKALAARLLGASADRARRCGQQGLGGDGHARVTFASDGSVSNVDVEPPFRDTDVGRCVADELGRTSLPAFEGGPITVRKSFALAP